MTIASRSVNCLSMSKQLVRQITSNYVQEKIADPNLIAKWKKQGYENLCCLRCIQVLTEHKAIIFMTNTCRLVTQTLQPTASAVCLRTNWRRGGLFLFLLCFSLFVCLFCFATKTRLKIRTKTRPILKLCIVRSQVQNYAILHNFACCIIMGCTQICHFSEDSIIA